MAGENCQGRREREWKGNRGRERGSALSMHIYRAHKNVIKIKRAQKLRKNFAHSTRDRLRVCWPRPVYPPPSSCPPHRLSIAMQHSVVVPKVSCSTGEGQMKCQEGEEGGGGMENGEMKMEMEFH